MYNPPPSSRGVPAEKGEARAAGPPPELPPNAPLYANPFVPTASRLTRRTLYRIRDELRPHWPDREKRNGTLVQSETSRCGYTRCGQLELALRTDEKGQRSAFMRGVVSCSSVWSCPVCSSSIRSERAKEVRDVVSWHGAEGTFLLSLTVRHGWGDDPTTLQKGVSEAWSAFCNGEPWRRFAAEVGLVGSVRGLETTHGKHGWHPHIHALLFVANPEALRARLDWLRARWADVVARQLGEEHRSNEHGLDLRQAACADYLVKLGLEVTSPSTKVGKGGRSPWEIAAHYVVERRAEDLALFLAYAAAFKGARQLTWTRGLKAAAGIREKTDAELAAEAEGEVSAVLPGAVWDRLRRVRGAVEAMLCIAEDHPHDLDVFVAWIVETYCDKADNNDGV